MSVLSNATASVSETENVVFRVLVWLNGIVEAFDDKAASRRSKSRFGSPRGVSMSTAALPSRFIRVETRRDPNFPSTTTEPSNRTDITRVHISERNITGGREAQCWRRINGRNGETTDTERCAGTGGH
jgi:hypothetical protein